MSAKRLGLRAACALLALAMGPLAAQGAPARAHRPPPRRPAHVQAVSYAAPAGNLPAGHLRGATYDAVLPSGRIVTPAGTSVLTGMNALGVALSPDGRFAIVSNDDEREALVHSMIDSDATGGFSLAVVDVATMRVVDRYRGPSEKFWLGVVALPDPANPAHTLVLASGGPTNAVYAFQLDGNGRLTPDAKHVVVPPVPGDPAYADMNHSYPGTIVVSRDERRAYVVNEAAGTVSAIDTATRTLTGPTQQVGYLSARRGARRGSSAGLGRRTDALRRSAAARGRSAVRARRAGHAARIRALVPRSRRER